MELLEEIITAIILSVLAYKGIKVNKELIEHKQVQHHLTATLIDHSKELQQVKSQKSESIRDPDSEKEK